MTHSTITRRTALAAGAAALAAPAFAQGGAWPGRGTVKIIVPYPAGGSTDVLTRIIGERLRDKLGGTWVIENRPGAGGNVGIDAVAKSDPDGYTIGSATVGHFAINQYLYGKMSYDADRDLAPVSMTWELPNVAVVPSEHVPAKTMAEFINWAKARPDGIFYGSPGVGTTPHLSGALFCVRNGIRGTHVPFRGASATIPAMLKGDVQFAIDNLASYTSIIEGGQMRALAMTSPTRWPTLPAVPTMAEAGMNNFVVTSWAAFVLPKATPRDIVDRLSAALRDVSADRSVQERFQIAGARSLGSTPEEVTALSHKERPMWQEMVKVSGAKLE
ncbi:tripartite tricarboxylate transporter substrate binding protein [Enterovirga sp.]|jgi:tripartite-type tricarboxylate transporter receptor subunit TctC|uniref:Bug family tripartite tricarboxylate transporter substrate binding protein n=1 Tax=Enterovirga sp. TaxID=2026350 RepID=UPI002615A6BF|nr:tripartite tricarboxylate transporter substrate binding protein [Enterovirga sp.]MDB5589973.1 family tricarboxylate transporter, receptor protein [Enterovirga sp.]